MTKIAVATALAFAVLGATSCSKGPPPIEFSGPTAPTAPLTKEDFVQQANVVCRQAERQIAQRTEDNGPIRNDNNSREDQAKLVEAIEPIGRQAVAILRNLTPPPEDATKIRVGLDRMSNYMDEAKRDPTISIDPVALVDADLNAYGLSDCFAAG